MQHLKISLHVGVFAAFVLATAPAAMAQVGDPGPSPVGLFLNGVLDVPPAPVGPTLPTGTQMNLLTGGAIGSGFDVEAGSELNIYDGTVGSNLTTLGEVNVLGGFVGSNLTADFGGQVNVFAGEVSSNLTALAGGEVNVSGGNVNSGFKAFGAGVVNVSGGSMQGLSASNGGVANISGGAFSRAITVFADSEMNVSGGTYNDIFFATVDSEVNLFGYGFELDGIPLVLTPGVETLIPDRDVTLTGFFENGTLFSFGLNTSGLLIDRFDTTATLTVTLAVCGDLDGDGFVGINDLNIILGNWNQSVTTGSLLDGDVSGDGFVGIDDLGKVLGNWNAGSPPGQAAVPEPGAVGLLGVLCVGGLARRIGRG